MTTTDTRPPLVRSLAEAPVVPCPCGTSTRLLTIADGPEANIHVTEIRDSAPHYHQHCTEFYYILEGTGTLELGSDRLRVAPGMLARIDPGVVHRLRGDDGQTVKIIVFGVPALHPDDEYLV